MYWLMIIYIIVATVGMSMLNLRTIRLRLRCAYFDCLGDTTILSSILIMLRLIFMAGLRELYIGTDTIGVYGQIYWQGYGVSGWEFSSYEALFIYFIKLIYFLIDDYRAFLFAVAIITVYIFCSFFIKHKEYNLCIGILGFFVFLFCPSMNAMRQILAVSIGFMGIIFLDKGSFKLWLLTIIIAMYVHITSVVLFLYFFPYWLKKHNNDSLFYIFMALSPFLVNLSIKAILSLSIFDKFIEQILAFSFSSMNMKFYIFPLLMLPLILVYRKKLIELSDFNYIHICGYLMIFLSVFLSGYLWFAFRIMFYFIPSMLIIIAQLGKCANKWHNKLLINLYIIISMLITFYYVYIYMLTDQIYPYDFMSF